jgi:hypothetical protein
VIHKASDAQGRIAMTVRVAPDRADEVRTKFGSSVLTGE